MFESHGGFILLAGCGLVLLRPGDVPLIARFAGRLVGLGVRGLRGLRTATEEMMKEGENMLGKQGADVGAVREDLQASLSKFDSLRSAFSRDMASVRAFAPVQMLRSRVRQSDPAAEQVVPNTEKKQTQERTLSADEQSGRAVRRVASVGASTNHWQRPKAGVDFITRSIEEAALARQQKRILGNSLAGRGSDDSRNGPRGS